MNDLAGAPLGQRSETPANYDPSLLFPIPRALGRADLALGETPSFVGHDSWTAFEVSWRNARGRPEVGVGLFTVPCSTPFMVESKSLKLYLNSLNDTVVPSREALEAQIRSDLVPVLWGSMAPMAPLQVTIVPPQRFDALSLSALPGTCIDDLDIDWAPPDAPPLPRVSDPHALATTETLHSHLLRSLCRVTAQPDWGSVSITYEGSPLCRESLMRYLLGFRYRQEFHEPLTERIFTDLWRSCQPRRLFVEVRFTRRGGIDINPVRASDPDMLQRHCRPEQLRLARQ